MTSVNEAIDALLAYQQADMEGVMVLTSRQAIHEVADELRRLRNVAKKPAGCDPCSWPECGCQYSPTPAVMPALAQPTSQDAVRAAFIAGFESFPGPKGSWDRAKISRDAAKEWEAYVAAQPPAAPVETEVQDTWLVGGPPDFMAMSGSVESERVIQLHMRRKATDDDRKWLLDAINAKLLADREQVQSCSAGTASDMEQVFTSICDELGCTYDNESALMAIDNLKRRAAGYVTNEPQPTQVTADQAAEDVRREREAKAERDRYAKMTTAEKCAVQGDGFINDYD